MSFRIQEEYFTGTVSSKLYFAGIILLAIALPLSKSVISLAELMLGIAWLSSGDLPGKIKSFFTSPITLLVSGYFLLHFVGLLYTENFKNASDSIRIKLPLLILPLMFAQMKPLSEKQFKMVLALFVTAVLASTLISTSILLGILHRKINNIHDISIYVSHIRFALMICLSIFILLWFSFFDEKLKSPKHRLMLLTMAIWFILFLILLESVTGLLIFGFISFCGLLFFGIKTKNNLLKMAISLSILFAIMASILFLRNEILFLEKRIPFDASKLETLSAEGTPYTHWVQGDDFENGYPVWIYICQPELEREWNKRSQIKYDAKDERNQDIQFTLLRFLTSKNLRKDAQGVKSLSDKEVRSIEKGIANVSYQEKTNLSIRLRQILWELKGFSKGGDPSGHSVAQRLEFWKASLGIIRENKFIGVGTGDVKSAFANQYDLMNSRLSPERRLDSHNQYLYSAVSFGIPGLLIFLASLLAPFFFLKELRSNYLYLVFFLLITLSMISEDTLETQQGVTFYAFFNALFIWGGCRNLKTLIGKSKSE